MVLLEQVLVFSWLLWISGGMVMHLLLGLKNMLPLIHDTVTYGKLRLGHKDHFPIFSVPKRWFTHFYAWGSIWNCSLLVLLVAYLFILDHKLPEKCSIESYSLLCFEVLLAMTLVCCQVLRRLYECLYISVFSQSKMHLIHYFLGLYFYTAIGPTVLVHLMKCAVSSTSSLTYHISLWNLFAHCCWYHSLAVLVFIWASRHQSTCHKILAQLRQSPTVNSHNYAVPHGDWFDHVTCPHYLAEIIIYSALFFVFGARHVVWLLVVVFVISTLFLSARQTHDWYKSNFPSYPTQRKIIIPWLL